MKRFILAALLQAGCSNSSPVSQPATTPGVASPALPAGWKALTAQDQSFSYAVPENATQQAESELPAGHQCVHTQVGGPVYLLAWSRAAGDKRQALAKYESDNLRGARLVSRQELEQEGLPGVDLEIQTPKAQILTRILAGNGRLFTATLLVPPTQVDQVRQQQAPVFFSQLRGLSPEAPAMPQSRIQWKQFQSKDGSLACLLPQQTKERPGSALCLLPGRLVQVTWGPNQQKFSTWKAKFGHTPGITDLHEVKQGPYRGLEFSLEDPQLHCWRTSRLLMGKGRIYTASVGGLKEDPTLKADVRKVLDSLKPLR